jgi:hypothetical protein
MAIAEPQDWALDDIAGHGFNAVSIFLPTAGGGRDANTLKRLRAQFDSAARRGLRVIPFLVNQKDASFERLREAVTGTIEALKDHPMVAAWMILDEPSRWWANSNRNEQQIGELYKAAKQADPHRAVFINDNVWTPGKGGYGSLDATDIGCFDVYPIGQFGNAVKLVADKCAAVGRDSLATGKPSAFWLQLYGYDDAVREPTPAEARAMTYLAYISGIRALLYWIYKPMNPALWDGMKQTGAEIDRLDRTLMRSRCTRIGTVELSTHYALWESEAGCYLVACNASAEPAEIEFDLSKLTSYRHTRRKDWFGAGERRASRRVVLSLDRFEPQVVELN